jgi:uncharacterized protein YodC (DUF2158 family)
MGTGRIRKVAQFKAGDVVRINPIKGPWMIVESCEDNNAVCFWFDKTDAGHRETFVTGFLELRKSAASGISGFAGTRRRNDS